MPTYLGKVTAYSLDEISSSFGWTVKSLREKCKSGELQARKFGSKWTVSEQALELFLRGDRRTEPEVSDTEKN
ncbi:MAG: helix-turn-helix domain-containing protein [Calditrichaeota bacterium]|nr:helix-turn-helix domain-containing protein [Calditrichota bacterium]MCB0267741.1 helix-turn-helix domain-containing protein [Calditrichota bacterium]